MMRKRIIDRSSKEPSSADQNWLDLERLAQVEITSEDAGHPVESALTAGGGPGWLAGEPGEQTLRLVFDEPQALRQIQLVFEEEKRERTQEFVLRWSGDGGRSYREILRQQYTFSPPGATREIEDYVVNLQGVTVLELSIVPDISRGDARASLILLRLALPATGRERIDRRYQRGSGILLHVTSLPSPYGIGDLGPWAYRFADFLEETRQSYWQVLPLSPTAPAYGNSPYSSVSTFAGNTLLLSPDLLVRDGLIEASLLEGQHSFSEERCDFDSVIDYKKMVLDQAYDRFSKTGYLSGPV